MREKRSIDEMSLAEEREHWDNEDLSELRGGRWRSNEGVKKPLTATFAIRLDADSVAELRALAQLRGLGPTQLVRSWIVERLAQEHRLESAMREQISEESEPHAVDEVIARAVMHQLSNAMQEAAARVFVRAYSEVLDAITHDLDPDGNSPDDLMRTLKKSVEAAKKSVEKS